MSTVKSWDIDTLLERQSKKSSTQVEERVASFYAYFLSASSDNRDKKMIHTVSTILYPKDYAALPPARGKHEAAARARDLLLKKDYLGAQLRDIVEQYADAVRMRESSAPDALRQKLNGGLDVFGKETVKALSTEIQQSFLKGFPVQRTTKSLRGILERETSKIRSLIKSSYLSAGRYQVLQGSGENRDKLYRFVAEKTEQTCEECLSRDGKLYTLQEVLEEDLLLPLHPNCRCGVVPQEIYSSVEEREDSAAPSWLTQLKPYAENMGRIPSDLWSMLEGFAQAQLERWDENTLAGKLDWLTAGILSVAWKGSREQAEKVLTEPSLYNIGNWLTMGLFDLGQGALTPDEPLSLEHWLSSLGLASALYEAYNILKKHYQLRDFPKKDTVPDNSFQNNEIPKKLNDNDRHKLDKWTYKPDEELYLKYKKVFDNPQYYDQLTGEIRWPKNDGFQSNPVDAILNPGDIIDRYGGDAGFFVSPKDIPYSMRSLAPGSDLKPYHVYEIIVPITVKAGSIAPWFDEIGGGIQYLLPESIETLLEARIIRRIQ